MNEKAKCSGEDKKRQALLTQHLSLCHNDKIFLELHSPGSHFILADCKALLPELAKSESYKK